VHRADLVRLRQARDRIDRDFAEPLDIPARTTGLSVTDVCLAVGSTSLGSFSARFTELMGLSPSAYRAADHGEVDLIPSCVVRQATRAVRVQRCRSVPEKRTAAPGPRGSRRAREVGLVSGS
jgi:hypothetical protein